MGPGFVCSRGCTAAPLTGGLWFHCIDVQDLLGTVVASLAQCSGRPAGRRTWVGLSKNVIFRVFQNNVLFANVIVASLSTTATATATAVLLPTKQGKVAKVTDSDRRNLFTIFFCLVEEILNPKRKWKKIFGALYPGENCLQG